MAYVDLTTRFVYNLQTVFGDFNKLANNDKFVNENGWQDGTVGVFYQAAAPTGWTKIVTADARALRITSGSGGGVGGSQDPATTITLAHTNSISTDGSHTHVLQSHTAYLATSGTDKSSATSVIPIMAQAAASFNYGAKMMGLRIISGAVNEHTKKNEAPMTGGPYTTGSGGSHNHSGATNSQLSDLSLAYVNVVFASKDTSSGYTDLSSTFVHNTRHVFDYLSQLAANDAFNYARRTPAGTVSLFGSATAPTGWTKLTSANAALLRVVSGTGGGSGGVADPATTITLGHNHGSVTSDGAHTHSMPAHTHELSDANSIFAVQADSLAVSGGQIRDYDSNSNNKSGALFSYTDTDGSGTSTSNGAHQHSTGTSLSDITLAYFNSIQASKDSAGAPAAYTDYTAFFVDQALLAYQDLQVMANNDAYLYYHTMPSAAVCFFFQAAAPLNWTKVVSQNDCIIRVVSGTTGGTGGGSGSISAGLTLAHTHTLDTQSHTHSLDHTHNLATGTAVGTGDIALASPRIFGAHSAEMYRANTGAGADTSLGATTETVTVTTDSTSHNHGGLTGSALSNVTLAYADVIMCSKN